MFQKTLIILSFFSLSIFSQQATLLSTKNNLKSSLLSSTEHSLNTKNFLQKPLMSDKILFDTKQKKPGEKNILIGMGLSALLPGAGEYYAKSYIKAAIFLGVEVLAWASHIYFQNKGNKQNDSFEAFANQYWSVRKYAQWLVNEQFNGAININPNEPDLNILRNEIMACESLNFSHTMPEYYSQQYYELIGKYQNFQAGWTNLAHEPTRLPGPFYYETYKDDVFNYYAGERQKANDYFNYAKTGITVVIVNHILSIADAAWSVSIYNKNLKMQTGIEMKSYLNPTLTGYHAVPTLNLKIDF